jgi:Tfp pilus assembly protein PilX
MSQKRPNSSCKSAHRRQSGVVTLTMTIILLVLVTMVAIYTGRSVLFEQRVSGNDFRSRQAFEAAESGLQVAISYLSSVGGADKDEDGATDSIFDTDADGVGNTNTMAFADGSQVTVSMAGAFPAFTISATGLSDDRTATRTIRAIGTTADGLPALPGTPLTTRSAVVIDGSATIYNPEGNSTIWSGSDVGLGSNNSTATQIADPTDIGYPSCMDTAMTCSTVRSSNRVSVGLDVLENDTSLGSLTTQQTFAYFFGMSMEQYRASRVSLEVAPADANNLVTNANNPGVQLATGEIIWIEGDTSFENNTTVGCSVQLNGNSLCAAADTDPTIVIVNGDLVASGTPNITGLLYVTGNFELVGNMTVQGAMIISGEFFNDASGSFDLWYNSSVLDSTRDNGPLAGAPGSWHDW